VEQQIDMMDAQTAPTRANKAHVIVVGNEKGGSGKTTTAMHIATGLLVLGKSVGCLDLDVRQRSFTRYMENRKSWVGRRDIAMPEHIALDPAQGDDLQARDGFENEVFLAALEVLHRQNDFIIIDCPGSDTHLSRLGHAAADTLITPINESFVDFDLLAHVDPDSLAILGPSIYAELVWSCRKARAATDGASIDWVVIRNRTSHIHAKNRKRVEDALDDLSRRLGFRQVSGLSERVVFREMFPAGITLLDLTNEEANASLTMSHVAARQEVRALLSALNLPGVVC
jgi:chromosome partitioning protein